MIEKRIVHKLCLHRVVVCIFVLHELKFDLNVPRSVPISITDPQRSHFLPIGIAFDDREPRSCHKVDPLESQAGPEVIEPYAFDCAACDEWL